MTRTRNAWISYLATRVVAFVADSAAFAFAYAAAFALRFDFQEPIFGWTPVAWSFLTVWAVQAIAFAVTGCAWRAWRRTGILDLPRFVVAFALSAVTLTLMRYFLPSEVLLHIRPPYTITLINTVLAFVACVGLRLLWGRYARVRRAIEFVRRNACAGVEPPQVIAEMGCSRSLANLRFRQATGHTILDEIHAVRLADVKELMLKPTLDVASIPDFCGYASLTDLRRVFKQRVGCTMRQFRNSRKTLFSP